jgi:AraC-like DNA-binding protein
MHVIEGPSAGTTGDPGSPSLSDRVRHRLVETLGDGDASVGGVARAIGMGVPALQRGLREGGTSFGWLIADVRRQLSVPCVHAGARSVDEIAVFFGFPDANGFYWVLRRRTRAAPPRYLDSTASH